MQAKILTVLPADKKNFEKFQFEDDSNYKLEFISDVVGYHIKYGDKDYGTYETNNLDLMIKEFLEELAVTNNGDADGVKARLDTQIEKSNINNQQYPTIYKNNVLKYLLGLEDNVVKSACVEQKITYQQLADAIGLSESSLRSAVSTSKISKQVEKSIEMYLKIIHLEKELEKSNTIKQVLKSWLS
jgi:hypothetical protein